jgi:hypothetical protein
VSLLYILMDEWMMNDCFNYLLLRMIVCMTTKNSWWHCLYTLVNKYDFDFDFDFDIDHSGTK